MARPRDDDVRRKILLATFNSVAQRGVAGISLREIARQVGISTGTVTYHFTATRQLILDAIDYGYEGIPDHVTEQTPVERLEWVLDRYVIRTAKRRDWWRFWLSVTSYAHEDTDVQSRLSDLHASLANHWKAGLEDGRKRGVFHPEMDAEAEALRLSAFAHGVAVIQLMDGSLVQWASIELNGQLDRLRLPKFASEDAATASQNGPLPAF